MPEVPGLRPAVDRPGVVVAVVAGTGLATGAWLDDVLKGAR
ncbi:Unknown protein sequence [Pseudomonas savastanoi pv. glycinea]|uniref:Uncharacterized protein n=1 Tax=Pseudomonas savastanoi pv. glycinea TaxID=318 RepID=A0ABR5LD05_PSESG|nr:Unknown protein sequence [Pseudomonas savastanoi pv. glycinea]KPC44399.1 Unknown protein sequence [Pseudomonas savastanoi pv. glycinea]